MQFLISFSNLIRFSSNIDVLNLRNGLLNIQSKELQPHTSEYLSLVQMPTEYKPDAECPKISEFFKEVLRPDELDVMFRLIGYCLHKNCEYEKAAMLYGTGANGKGVVIRIIERFLGEDNCSHRSLQHLDTNRFAVADVCGKLVNTFADLKSVKLSETGNFKMLVSGDSISGEHKFQDSFKFRNFAKLIFSANEIPESNDKSDAFYRRWLNFHFDKKFVGGKEDTKLLEKLTTPDELNGLLNMALTGLKQLIDESGFHDKDIEDIRRDYEEHTNDVNTFLYRECLVDITRSDYSTLATDLYAAYVTFCVKRGSRPKEMSVFGKKLADQGIYNMRHQDHGDRDRYYDGIRLLRDMGNRIKQQLTNMNLIEEKVPGLPYHFHIFIITGHTSTKIIFQFYLYCFILLVSSVSNNREMPSHPSHSVEVASGWRKAMMEIRKKN